MTPLAIVAFMLVAGAFHASWNLLAKGVTVDRGNFLIVVTAITGVGLLPWALLHLPSGDILSPAVGFVLVRGVVDAVYIYGLGKCYQSLDLSLAYPLVRGIGPLMATLLAVVLLGERPAIIGLLGIVVSSVAIGSMALTGAGGTGSLERRRSISGIFWVVLTGITIGSYTVIDKVAMEYWDPVAYMSLVEIFAAIMLSVPLFLSGRVSTLVSTFVQHRRAAIGCAICVSVSYVLALIALKHAYASYIAPLREVSVLFGVLMGILILRERHARRRIPSAIGIVLGLSMVALAL